MAVVHGSSSRRSFTTYFETAGQVHFHPIQLSGCQFRVPRHTPVLLAHVARLPGGAKAATGKGHGQMRIEDSLVLSLEHVTGLLPCDSVMQCDAKALAR